MVHIKTKVKKIRKPKFKKKIPTEDSMGLPPGTI